MMTTREFQQRLSTLKHLTIIGPLAETLPKKLSEPTVFVDGGCLLRPTSMENSISVGDGDSSSPQAMDLLLPTEKNVSDLGFVLRHLPPQINSLELCGFFGQRLDHQLANLGMIHEYLLQSPAIVLFDEARAGWGIAAKTDTVLNIQGPFSLFCLQPGRVEMTGQVRYKLTPETLLSPLSSRGLSNEGHGELHLVSDTPIFILLSLYTDLL